MPAEDGLALSVYMVNVNSVLAMIINLERGFYFFLSASAASSAPNTSLKHQFTTCYIVQIKLSFFSVFVASIKDQSFSLFDFG